MKRLILEQRLGFAATVAADGTPNLSPKGTTTILDDERLLFADIRSPTTVCNLERNPAIELNVVDAVLRKGYRFKGRAVLHAEGETYERGLGLLRERGYEATAERIRTIVVIEVDTAAPLISPVYDAGVSEDAVAEVWRRRVAALHGGQVTGDDDGNAALVRRFHELQSAFYGGGQIEPLVDLLCEDVRWHVPGRNAISGDYAGRDDVLGYFRRRREVARARFRLDVREVVATGEIVFQLVAGIVERAGDTTRTWETAGVLRVCGGRISECWMVPFDQHLFDEIWA